MYMSNLNNNLLMSQDEIHNFNKKINGIVSLSSFKNVLSKEELENIIFQNDNYFPLYIDSVYYEHQNFSDKIIIRDLNTIKYAITLKRVNIRTFPTLEKASYYPDDTEFDQFQETTFEINEPILVLTEDKTGKWVFVQSKNYNGWTLKKDIAFFPNKEEFIKYIESLKSNFITTISSKTRLTFDTGEFQDVNMGTKFILKEKKPINGSFKVIVPIKDSFGMVNFATAKISTSNAVYQFLPYTRKNVIAEAFKMLNEPYGWGGEHGFHDCSSFTQDIFKTFGFTFPRNADTQEILPGKRFSFKNLDYDDRLDFIKTLKPGALLFMKDHVMLYLGFIDNSPYVINDITSYYQNEILVRDYKVAVTDIINARRSDSKSFLESLTTAIEIP
ncbi:NLP/P60 protein [Thermodesulfobium narugense DSM 14796]|uniref:NLP/P60 protein n=1 Tax=Thermodesulfobium narugense DSM 14796 TaxID=747365 RepID=M1E835_9BACT|nr:NLP/P60 protein [Thermodesulfobium narugense DSM 14796]